MAGYTETERLEVSLDFVKEESLLKLSKTTGF